MGNFEGFVGRSDRAMLDSLTITARGGPCEPYENSSVTWRQLPLAAGQSETVVNATLAVTTSHPPARLALDSSCAGGAYMLEDQNVDLGPTAETLGPWIDEISDSIRGRWRLNCQISRGDDYGHFSGAQGSRREA